MSGILLSISILISNRPDTAEKCLRSLASLRRKVPSELILVDTGCGDQVRRMIEPYADKIIEFKWCNDFSKARNVGLWQAEGEWFLYLDDDEWFEDTEEIEEFFLSGRYQQYNSGQYLVRNYLDLQGTGYRDTYVSRMFRLLPGAEFVYAVHEIYTGPNQPGVRLNSFAHHYGYAFQSEEQLQRHARRNIDLLLAEHEKDPGELHHVLQLVQEYNAAGEWDKSVEMSRQAIEALKKAAPGLERDSMVGGFYANIVRVYAVSREYERTVETGENYLRMGNPSEMARAAVYFYLCVAYMELGRHDRCLRAAEQYEEIRERWLAEPDDFLCYENLLTFFIFSEDYVKVVLYRGLRCGMKAGNPSISKKFFDKIKWNTQNDAVDTGAVDVVQDLVTVWLQTDADEAGDYTEMMRCLLQDSTLAMVVTLDMDILSRKVPKLLENRRAAWAELGKESWIFLYYKVKNRLETDTGRISEDYRRLWHESADALMRAKELRLWELAHRDHVDMGQILSDIPISRWEKATEVAVGKLDWRDAQELDRILRETLDADSCHMLEWSIAYRQRRIQMMVAEKEAERASEAFAEELVRELLAYAAENEGLYRRMYRDELFQEASERLPRRCQASLKLLAMGDAVERGDFPRALSDADAAMEKMPELSDALRQCIYWISCQESLQQKQRGKGTEPTQEERGTNLNPEAGAGGEEGGRKYRMRTDEDYLMLIYVLEKYMEKSFQDKTVAPRYMEVDTIDDIVRPFFEIKPLIQRVEWLEGTEHAGEVLRYLAENRMSVEELTWAVDMFALDKEKVFQRMKGGERGE